ncbi:MAG: HEPN domain-containing protein [Ginsengibacter sp.]
MTSDERNELVRYRINKAKETFSEIDLLIENRLWNTAINRLYYACYYAVIALLIDRKIETLTHTGTRQMFGLHFIKNGLIEKDIGKFYSRIFDLRQTGDYDDFIDFSKDQVMELLEPAEKLIRHIESMLET